MNTWNSKAWDGCLQARAIKVLHSAVCVSDYYCYYYYYYYYYCCCCRCCCCCYISTQTSSNYKACADWPRLRSMRQSDYLITGRARGTREGERGPTPLFSPRASSTFLLSLPQKSYEWLRWGELLWNLYARVKVLKELGEDGPGAQGE